MGAMRFRTRTRGGTITTPVLVTASMLAMTALTAHVVEGFLPPQNPGWAPSYNMTLSTISMACNQVGGAYWV